MKPGDKVLLKANPGRIGFLGNDTDGPPSRKRVLVNFLDGDEQYVLEASLEKVAKETPGPYAMIVRGRYGRVDDLRGAVTYYRLNGKLANLIYSLNTTNTQFLAYQFKPVLHFLDSPCRGILIADEVGLGKTIEAGLIWTELRARSDARRLLVVCPAMLREKWQMELSDRFGVQADIVDAADLLKKLQTVRERPQDGFALIASMQGLRPPRGWDDEKETGKSESAKLARFLNEVELDDPLLDLVVIDEAHYLRNRETQTHRLGALLRPVALNMVLLSATPIQLRSSDLFHLLNLLDEDAFPYEYSFSQTLEANAPIVHLRDRLLASSMTQTDFLEALRESLDARIFSDNAQIEYMINNPPSDEVLDSPRGRSEIAERLDRINPLAKVVTRTRKRDVQEMRVVREPIAIKAKMNPTEEAFYLAVTNKVRAFCEDLEISTGFMLTIPQRQMSSCMAAACLGWSEKMGKRTDQELDETVFEAFGDTDAVTEKHLKLGPLLVELVKVARSVGDYKALRQSDSKYAELLKNLRSYWRNNPRRKVVLFSFYRHTLDYLSERLEENGIKSVLVYGGMDKHGALQKFANTDGPDILLSSEVASEGVDLQFSSLLINYDLPWNPMRIEQRIGRIDRIGQEAKKILIWNFMYADTIDDRVYVRLLERLDIFKRALGSIEAILGEVIRELGYKLLTTHSLTPEQEEERINLARVAIETTNRNQDDLENQATQLIAHGDYIQNKVRAARELGRYISGEDLFAYVRDFMDKEYEGTRLIASDKNPNEISLELSTEARVHFDQFLVNQRLQGRTKVLAIQPPRLLFENKLGSHKHGVERVTQDHPLVRFVGEQLRTSGKGVDYFPVSAVELHAHSTGNAPAGIYAYAVSRWTLSGSRDLERLEYIVCGLENATRLKGEDAERLVNNAAMEGKDWLGASNVVNHSIAAEIFTRCQNELENDFNVFTESYRREDRDRINLMVNMLERHLQTQRERIEERINRYREYGNEKQRKMIPAEEGRLKKQETRINEKIEMLRIKEMLQASDSFVSGGVIRIV
jgi:superfamily II DNA or RNA helicase